MPPMFIRLSVDVRRTLYDWSVDFDAMEQVHSLLELQLIGVPAVTSSGEVVTSARFEGVGLRLVTCV